MGEDFGVVVTFDPKVLRNFLISGFDCMREKSPCYKNSQYLKCSRWWETISYNILNAADGGGLEWCRSSHELLHRANEVTFHFDDQCREETSKIHQILNSNHFRVTGGIKAIEAAIEKLSKYYL